MATSILRTYKSKIYPAKNMLIESIADYLSSLTPIITRNDYQYNKVEQDISIKLDLSESYVGFNDVGNYCSITQDSKTYYYFIISSKWLSLNCVQLNLSLDTINTFQNYIKFDKRTNILRQHKDRFEKKYDFYKVETGNSSYFTWLPDGLGGFKGTMTKTISGMSGLTITETHTFDVTVGTIFSSSVTVSGNTLTVVVLSSVVPLFTYEIILQSQEYSLNRLIDFVPEGINPQLYKTDVAMIGENNFDYDWYLVYRNHTSDADSAVDCFVCTNERLEIHYGSNLIIYPSNLDEKYTYSIMTDYNDSDVTVTDNNGETYTTDKNTMYIVGRIVLFKKVGNKIYWFKAYNYDHHSWNPNGDWIECDYLATNISSNARRTLEFPLEYNKWLNDSYAETVLISSATSTITISNIDDIDKTDPKIIKIIKLPYCPTEYITFDEYNNYFDFNSSKFEYNPEMNMLKLKDLSIKFGREITPYMIESPYDVLHYDHTPSISEDRIIGIDSKLFSSEFYVPKLIYDSFSFAFNLERLSYIPTNYTIYFKPTSTINSRFLFDMPQYIIDEKSSSDYDTIFVVQRNNEETLYNSSYINYIKNGFNYDVKSKNANLTRNWILSGVQIVGAVASFASSAATGGAGVVAGISLVSGAIATLTSSIASSVQAERDIQQKLVEYKNQAVNVETSDDVDLMSYYADNRLKYVIYACSDNIGNLVDDLFYYCGYALNNKGVPNKSSRYWFNYVQCNAIFEEPIVSNAPFNIYLNDIKNRFEIGVTIYHKRNNSWDLDQVKENWEVSCL